MPLSLESEPSSSSSISAPSPSSFAPTHAEPALSFSAKVDVYRYYFTIKILVLAVGIFRALLILVIGLQCYPSYERCVYRYVTKCMM